MTDLHDLDPRPCPAKTPASTLRGWLDPLLQLLVALPPGPLQPRDRQQLAGFGFLEAALMCLLLERALRQAPELFPEIPGEADRLAEMGTRAGLWLHLHQALLAAADLAQDQYLLARREHVGRALELLRYYRGLAQEPPPGMNDPQAQRKRALIEPALRTIRAWQDRLHGRQ